MRVVAGGELRVVGDDLVGGEGDLVSRDEHALLGDASVGERALLCAKVIVERVAAELPPSLGDEQVATGLNIAGGPVGEKLIRAQLEALVGEMRVAASMGLLAGEVHLDDVGLCHGNAGGGGSGQR
jgi:hypothetical protein